MVISVPILVFDFDSTLVSVEALDELFAQSLDGLPDREERVAQFQEITDLGMAGDLSAERSLAQRLELLEADQSLIARVADQIQRSLSPSVSRNLDFFRDERDRIHVVSGGFEELIRPTLLRLSLPESRLHAHRFSYDEEGRVTGLDPDTQMGRTGKPGVVKQLRGDSTELWVIGDGATDLELRTLGLADRFFAFTENRHRESVVRRADHVVRSIDELLTFMEAK